MEKVLEKNMERDKKPLLSVVIPVYGTEKFLSKCLDSILNQTYDNIELIIVNDASPDGARDIIKKYQEENDNITVVNLKTNQGLFKARLAGAEVATGKYIAFVDSDDYISIDFYRLLIKQAEETDSDIVAGDYLLESEHGEKSFCNLDNLKLTDLDLRGEEVFDAFMKQQGTCFSWHTIWNKIYKKTLWDKCMPDYMKFAESCERLIMTEDIAFSCLLWAHAEHVTNIHGVYYYYVKHEGQSVAANDIQKVIKNLRDVDKVFGLFKEVLLKNDKSKYLSDFVAWRNYYGRIYYSDANRLGYLRKVKSTLNEVFENHPDALKEQTAEDLFFYSLKTQVGQQLDWYDDIKREIISDRTEYVSFDVFDTLVARPFFVPLDLFVLLNKDFSELTGATAYVDFAKIRVEAEKSCREIQAAKRPSNEDITLDDIYSYIQNTFRLDEKAVSGIKQKEIELEKRFCKARKSGKELYDLAVETNKKIIIVSDMYLPRETISEILAMNGYSAHQKIFVSNETGCGKWSGNMFSYILKDLNIKKPETVIHIGDNWHSDVEMAKKHEMRAGHLANAKEMLKNANPGIFAGESFQNLFMPNSGMIDLHHSYYAYYGLRCMLGMVADKIFDNPYMAFNSQSDFNADPAFIGYYTLGMHLFALVDWLTKEVSKDCETIHFVARDGYLLQKAYDFVREHQSGLPKSNYLYLSRKALVYADVNTAADLFSTITKLNIYTVSPKDIVGYYEKIINPDKLADIPDKASALGFRYENKFRSVHEYAEFMGFVSKECLNHKLLKESHIKLKEYFDKIIKQGDVLFDIGYSGREEAALSNLLGFSVDSFYIHSNSDMLDQRMQMANFNNKTFYSFKPTITGVIREHVMMKMSPSCVGYDFSSELPQPVFEEYKTNYAVEFVTELMQESALSFIRDFFNVFGEYRNKLYTRPADISQPFEYFLHYSKDFDRKVFDALLFEDDFGEGRHIKALDFWNKETLRTRLNLFNKEAGQSAYVIPPELQDLYQDGLFMAFYKKMNKRYPKGSKKRERVKKWARFFFRLK